jgi:hypothetical protein
MPFLWRKHEDESLFPEDKENSRVKKSPEMKPRRQQMPMKDRRTLKLNKLTHSIKTHVLGEKT